MEIGDILRVSILFCTGIYEPRSDIVSLEMKKKVFRTILKVNVDALCTLRVFKHQKPKRLFGKTAYFAHR